MNKAVYILAKRNVDSFYAFALEMCNLFLHLGVIVRSLNWVMKTRGDVAVMVITEIVKGTNLLILSNFYYCIKRKIFIH